MKKFTLLIVLTAIATASLVSGATVFAADDAKPLKVFILAGQSNMVGHSRGHTIATLFNSDGAKDKELTYRYAGRDFRLTDVHGHVVRDILA